MIVPVVFLFFVAIDRGFSDKANHEMLRSMDVAFYSISCLSVNGREERAGISGLLDARQKSNGFQFYIKRTGKGSVRCAI